MKLDEVVSAMAVFRGSRIGRPYAEAFYLYQGVDY